MRTKLPYAKSAGVVSTAVLIIASIAPNFLHIPVLLRPWVFIFAIVWTLIIISGVLS